MTDKQVTLFTTTGIQREEIKDMDYQNRDPLRHAVKCNFQGWYQKEMCLG